MFRNNNILNGLLALVFTFILGYIGLIFINKIFKDMVTTLDLKVKNEQARYKITEFILKEISSMETNYYKMFILTDTKDLQNIEKEIKKEIDDIENAIKILTKGGILENHIKLNLIEATFITDKIEFTPSLNQKLTLEKINLSEKLYELQQKIEQIKNISSNITTQEKIIQINLLATSFTKIKENVIKLLYYSRKNISELENNIQKEKQNYEKLEYIFSYFIMFLIIFLSYFLIKQIIKKSKELESITKKAQLSEQEALKANETKSKFLANMSHEIRTPLNAIIGFADILSTSKLDSKDIEKATIISKSAKVLLNIINDILDISKIESGKSEISKSSFNLRELVEQIVQLYTINTKQKNIRFLYRLDKNIPEFIISDETKIKQVLSNILSNAIKFTPKDGKICFDVELIKFENNIAKIKFSIKDEGIGISIEDQKKIFEPFSQADGSISKKYGGTGLGLTISLNIVKMLGSQIQLESEINKGSNFFFELDLEVKNTNTIDSSKFEYDFAICNVIDDSENIKEHLSSVVKYFGRIHQDDEIEKCKKIDLIFCFGDSQFYNKLKERKNRFNCPVVFVGNIEKLNNNIMKHLMDYFLDVPIYGSKIFNIIAEAKSIEKNNQIIEETNKKYKGKILVAEDNANNQLLMEIILNDLGLDVTIVENGKVAFEKYKENLYDLIFMDINMPIMDGIETLKEIKKYEKEHQKIHTPIIALTANAIQTDKEKYIEDGMDGYLSKPIVNAELIKLLDLYLDKN
ncbi:ATP-binding protein [Arcobacter cloacae]|uniref:Sensory/regulatory protein RpfC n=1 Tax=Arcobacter cloacae TaxID=1054034 RepID=A0A6M8NTW9_9BACT|nr:ATP-binding protein [Arcobacter cloacae]QKF90016.1 signal transduction sensor histidine kinase [Arcobacter cloacae]RXI37631.1 hypothetical protein CP963_12190 [Arcobacter cloacae]